MVKRFVIFSLLFVVFILSACGSQGEETSSENSSSESDEISEGSESASSEEKVTLSYSSHYPPTHSLSEGADQFFIDRVAELSNGSIEIEYYPAEQLSKASDQLNGLQQGSYDLATVGIPYVAGQTPLSMVTSLPSTASTAEEATEIANKIIDNELIKEEISSWGVTGLAFFTTATYEVATKDKPITSLEDFDGLKLKAPGGFLTDIGKPLGVTGVSIAGPESYEAVQRGTVDGVYFSYTSTKSYNLHEIIKYKTLGANFSTFSHFIGMNNKSLEKLSDSQIEAIQQAAQEAAVNAAQASDQDVVKTVEEYKEMGIEIYELTAEQKVEWAEAISPVYDEYINSLESFDKTAEAEELLEIFLQAAEEVAGQ